MEKYNLPSEEETEDEDLELEKSKKSKRFVSFFAKFISAKKESQSDEEKKDDDNRVDYLAFLKFFLLRDKETPDEVEQEQSDEDNHSLDKETTVEEFIDEELASFSEEPNEESAEKPDDQEIQDNRQILESISKSLKKGSAIDVDEIIKNVERDHHPHKVVEHENPPASSGTRDQVRYEEARKPVEPQEKIRKYAFNLASRNATPKESFVPKEVESLRAESYHQTEAQPPLPTTHETNQHSPESEIAPATPALPVAELFHERPEPQSPVIETTINYPLPTKKATAPAPRVELHTAPATVKELLDIPDNKVEKPTHAALLHEPTPEVAVPRIGHPHLNQEKIAINKSERELLQEASRIFVDGLSLRKIYENSRLNKNDLNYILSARYNKYELRKHLEIAMKRKNISFETIRNNLSGLHPSTEAPRKDISNPEVLQNPHMQLSHELPTAIAQDTKVEIKTKKTRTINHPFITLGVILILFIVFLLIYRH